MLNEALAQELVEQMKECTEYPLSIMDKSGTIIASSDKTRIGTFHEVAYDMVQTGKELTETSSDTTYTGVQKGISMLLQYKRKTLGVIGINGEIRQVRPIALVIKKSAELILECGFNRVIRIHQRDAKTQLINYLLYADVTDFQTNTLRNLGMNLGYQEALPRIPILISSPNCPSFEDFYVQFKAHIPKKTQDIYAGDDKGNIVLFLAYHNNLDGFFNNYKYVIHDYLDTFITHCRSQMIEVNISVGPMQHTWENYKFAYEKTLWTHNYAAPTPSQIRYFYEYMDAYLKSRLPLIELHRIFDTFSESFDEKFVESFIKHMGVLHANNYSFQKTSDQLFIHKNTLAFRIDKIRGHLGVDPIQNLPDRELTEYLHYYLTHINILPLFKA